RALYCLSALRLRRGAGHPHCRRQLDHDRGNRVRLGAARFSMTVAAQLDRDWQRFTPLKRLSRFAFYLFAVLALVISLRTIDVIPEFLYDAPDQMVDLVGRMWPPDLSYVGPTLKGLIETLHIATLGTIIAIVMAVPVGLLAARNVTPNFA